jgi:class 3 adenylate cyclase/pimeloyl-ACP methyl ester carboxylesterase
MEPPTEARQLLAIMFTDVVGYTALTERDEAGAVVVRDRHRELVQTLVKQFDGEVVDVTGDESLSIFPSALRAVDCALALQGALRSYPDLRLRIGVHVGDVLRRGGEVIGDGVNVAARIRPLAEPGGICISEPVYQMVRTRAHVTAQPLGRQSLKNVGEAVAVYSLSVGEADTPVRPKRRIRKMLAGALAAVVLGAVLIAVNRAAIGTWLALNAPRFLTTPVEQQIGFAETSDGVRIAYATSGSGPPVVFVLGWATHIKEGFGSPLYDLGGAIRSTSENHLLVRYDGRGFGLSDRDATDFSIDARVRDLEAVVDALGLERFALYAASAGGPTGIAYAARHPDRVTRLVLAATSAGRGSDPDAVLLSLEAAQARWAVYRTSWHLPSTRAMLVDQLAPDAGEVQRRVLIHFLGVAADGPAMAGLWAAFRETDVSEEATRVRTPTLVVSPDSPGPLGLSGGRRLSTLIPNSRFEILPGASHIAASVSDPRLLKMAHAFIGEGAQE